MDSARAVEAKSSAARVAGRYQIEAELGRGGMGAVYRALDEGTGQIVALKLLARTDAASAALFEREYETLAKIDHPRVIAVYDYGIAKNGQRYYTMELLGGSDLAGLAPLPWSKVCGYLSDVCASLDLLHAQRVVHRDVNPRNVRLDEAGRAKLLDFGALTSFGIASQLVGTPSCMAPEALRGKPLDARTDLFSVGAVMYWTLTGALPFGLKHLDEAEHAWRVPPVPPSHHVPGIPHALNELVLSLLSIDPLGRPASAADVIDRLNAIAKLDDESASARSDIRVSSWVLVGRGSEQAALEQLLAGTLRGRGGVVNLEGAAGVGRSRLLRELCIHARLSGVRTFSIAGSACAHEGALLRALAGGILTVAPDDARACLSAQLPELLTLLREVAPKLELPAPTQREETADDSLQRALSLQEDIASWLCEVSRRGPLLVAVDDAHLIHPSSAFVLTLLAQAAGRHPVLLVATRLAGRPAAPAVEQLSFLGPSMALGPLSQTAIEQLLCSAFGEVPNRARLAQRLTLVGRGNPRRMMQLLHKLVARKIVRYSGGGWILPAELADAALVGDDQQGILDRLQDLTPLARTLARSFALQRGALTEVMCFALSDEAPRKVLDALSLLLEEQILVVLGDGYRIDEVGWRKPLLAQLSSEQRRDAHLAIAHALWAGSPAKFEAIEHNLMSEVTTPQLVQAVSLGLHFLSGGETTLGGRILRLSAIELTVRGEGLSEAAPDLEAAVEVYRGLGAEPRTYLALLTPLVLAGTYTNFRLSYRYGEQLMEILTEVAGLKRARRLARFVGGRIALSVSLLLAYGAFLIFPKRRVSDSFRDLLLGLMGIGSALLAVCSLLLDKERVRRFAELLSMLRFFPEQHPVRMVHEFQLALVELTHGHYEDARQKARRALAYVRSPAAASLPADARTQLEGGILMLLGQQDALRTDDSIKADLSELDRLQTFTSRQTRVSTLVAYHGHRGERVPFLRYAEELDRLAAAGAVWRHDVTVPRLLWSSLAMCEDVMALKRAVQQLDPLADELPSIARLRDVIHACYLSERGMPREALARYGALFEAVDTKNPSLPDIQELGSYARILRKAGEAAHAKQICQAALRQLAPAERAFTMLTFCAELELPLAMSALGEHSEAALLLDALLSRQSHHDNPLLHGLAHGARAELAWAVADASKLEYHLAQMGEWFRKTEHPSLFAQYQRLTDKVHAPRQSATLRPERARSTEKLEIEAQLRAHAEPPERYRALLLLSLKEARAHAGYLYLCADQTLTLAASSGDEAPPAAALEALLQILLAVVRQVRPELTNMAAANQNLPRSQQDLITTITEEPTPTPLPIAWPGKTAFCFVLEAPTGPANAAPTALGALLLVQGAQPLDPLDRTFLTQLAAALAARY